MRIETESTLTDRTLAAMLTENTGRHFLDSGGAYGRNWERNQGLTVSDLLASPEITVHRDYVTLSVFHYLRQRLSYERRATARFVAWANSGSRADDSWLSNMEEWAEQHHDSTVDRVGAFNSYNEDNALSQDVQGAIWADDDGWHVLLQIHGGADIRGGYTAPRVFTIDGDGEPWTLFEWDRWSVVCDRFPHESAVEAEREAFGPMLPGMSVRPAYQDVHVWDHQSGGDWVEWGGSFVTSPWTSDSNPYGSMTTKQGEDGSWAITCPRCGSPCTAYIMPA